MFSPSVCNGNWVQERRDQGRANGEHSFPTCESKKRYYTKASNQPWHTHTHTMPCPREHEPVADDRPVPQTI